MSPDKDLQSGAGEIIALSPKEILRRRPHHEMTMGHVYFISRGDAIKIGFSSTPVRRMTNLQHQQTEMLELLATAPGTMRHERSLHEKFEHLAIGGEWFRPEQGLLDFIDHVRRTKQTPLARADEARRTRHQLNLIARQHKGNVVVINRVRTLVGYMRYLAEAKDDPERADRLRKGIVETAESLAQVLRDGGEYVPENHRRQAPKADCVV